MVALAVVLLSDVFLSFLPGLPSRLLWLAYFAVLLYGYVQLDRAGVRMTGLSKDAWRRRRMVYRDVLGLGRR
jgi:hypothetical protein